MVHAKVMRVRAVKRITNNMENERLLRAAASRIQLIMLNTDAVGDPETYWALNDAYQHIMKVVNPAPLVIVKEATHA